MTGDNTTSMSGHQAPAPGAESVRYCHAALLKLQDESPEWFASFEDCDPDLCPKGELMTLIADLEKRRMVMTPVINLPPAVMRAYTLRGVYTYEVQAEIVLTREGTRERIPAERFKVFLRVSRADIEESVKGVLISYIELKPLV